MKKFRNSGIYDFQEKVYKFLLAVESGKTPEQTDLEIFRSRAWWSNPFAVSYVLRDEIPESNLRNLISGFCGQTDQTKFFDPDVLRRLYAVDPRFFLKQTRFYRTFQNDHFFESLNGLVNEMDTHLKAQIKQFQLIREQHLVTSNTLEQARREIEKLDWLELISFLSIWWEGEVFKRLKAEPSKIRCNDPYLEGVFSLAINSKLKSDGQRPDWKDPQILMTGFLQNLEKAKNSKSWANFLAIIDKLKIYFHWQGFVDDFCYRGHRILFLEDGMISTIPETSEAEIKWQKINEQNRILENYFSRIGMAMLPPDQRGIPGFINPLNPGNQVRMELLGLPESIRLNKKDVKINHLTLFLSGLQAFHQERYVRKFEDILMEKPESQVLNLIEEAINRTNLWVKPMMGPLNIAPIEYIVDRVIGKIEFSVPLNQEEIEEGLRAMSLDVLKCPSSFAFNLSTHPFIRFGDTVIYLSRQIAWHNPSVMVQNAVFKGLEKQNKTQGKFGSGLEEIVKKLFKRAGFEVLQDQETTSGEVVLKDLTGKRITEIDALIRKGNEILVVQVKNTYYRQGTKSIVEYRQTHEKAGHQLDLSIGYIKENKEEFLKRFGLPINHEELKIRGLIISGTQEDSFEHFGCGRFPKISIFELDILLHNAKPLLVNWEFEALVLDLGSRKAADEKINQILSGQVKPEDQFLIQGSLIRQEEKIWNLKDSMDLWEGKEPSIGRLLECIEADWLWKDILHVKPIDCPSEADPDNVQEAFRIYQIGMQYFKKKEFKKALPYFQEASKLNPLDPEYLQMICDSLADDGNLEQGIIHYDELLSQFPDYKLGYKNRGMTFLQIGNFEKALPDFEKLVSLEPDNYEAFLHMEGIRYLLGKDQLSLDVINKIGRSAAINPEIWAFYFIRKIAPELRQLEEKPNKNKEDYRLLSKGYFLLNAYPFALKYLNKLLDIDPNDVNALYDRGWFKTHSQLNETAVDDFRRVIEIDPANFSAWDLIGSIEKEMKNFELAEKAYKCAIDLNPRFSRAIFNLGVLYRENSKNQEAEELFRKLVSDYEFRVGSLVHLGDISLENDQMASALNYYREAIHLGYNAAYPKYLRLINRIEAGN